MQISLSLRSSPSSFPFLALTCPMPTCGQAPATASEVDAAAGEVEGAEQDEAQLAKLVRVLRQAGRFLQTDDQGGNGRGKRRGGESARAATVADPDLHESRAKRQQHGGIYVWTVDGQPHVVGSIWSSIPSRDPSQRSIAHEFQSVSAAQASSSHRKQIGRRGVVPDWRPSGGGVEFKTMEDAPAPASKPAARLVQMRQLARRFMASTVRTTTKKTAIYVCSLSPPFATTASRRGSSMAACSSSYWVPTRR